MKPTTNGLFASQSSSFPFPRFRGQLPTIFTANQKKKILPNLNVVTFLLSSDSDVFPSGIVASRRAILVAPPLLAAAASLFLRPSISSATTETSTESAAVPPPAASTAPPPPSVSVAKEESITSRIYDASVLGEPMAVGKDKKRVWEKLLNARIVYLGEAEQVPTRDDKVLELEIVRNLKKRCIESDLQLSLALEAFPLDLQDQLNQYMDNRMDGEALKSFVSHWPAQRWEEYEPLLSYCRDNAIKLIACGTPLKILRTVQAIVPFGPSSYLSAQARVVEDHTMSQVIIQAVADGGGTGLLLVVTGANHVEYGSRGTGVPARISRKIRKKSQLVVLLDPERLGRRCEGIENYLRHGSKRNLGHRQRGKVLGLSLRS